MSNDGIGALRDVFGRAHLAVPPIPAALAPRVEQVEPWVFSSRPVRSIDAYMLHSLVDEARAGDIDDYVLASHGGHGVNSYALTYVVVLEPIVLMVQDLFGGVYTDNQRAAQRWALHVNAIGQFLDVAKDLGPDELGGRLIVINSFRVRSSWELIPGGEVADPERRQGPTSGGILEQATRWLAKRRAMVHPEREEQ